MIHTKVQVTQKYAINHDCYRMRLSFLADRFEIKMGQSIMINVLMKSEKYPEGMNVSRKYSIVSPSTVKDNIEIIFKVYRPCQQFPEGGQMTCYLERQVHVGSVLDIQGPFSRFQYLGNQKILLNGDPYEFKKIFFMVGGSGITPCYQTLKQIVAMSEEKIQLQLLFANKTQEDIILKKQLEEMAPRVKIDFLVEKGSQDWKGLKGLVTTEVLEKLCKLDDSETLYVHCGPVGMTKVIVMHFLKHYPKMKLFKF